MEDRPTDQQTEKMSKLENEMKNISLKMSEKDLTVSKINKKYNTLKEKVTIIFDMEPRLEIVEKKVDKIVNEPVQTKKAADNKDAENVGEIKCNQCDFVAKNKFGLKIHIHKKHSTAKFKCDTCDFTCESHSELVNHNDRYYHSHRRTLNKENEKLILDEFQQLDEDGFLIHRKLDW